MHEPLPQERPGVIQIKIYGPVALFVAHELDLPEKEFDQELHTRYASEIREERLARHKFGWSHMIPERNLFARVHEHGIPNVFLGDFLREILESGYFLIAADYEIDDDDRERARLAFSCKSEDASLYRAKPSKLELVDAFERKVWQFAHIHDRRRIHPETKRQIGNNVIDLCGHLQIPTRCRSYKKLHFHEQGETADNLYSYDVCRHPDNVRELAS